MRRLAGAASLASRCDGGGMGDARSRAKLTTGELKVLMVVVVVLAAIAGYLYINLNHMWVTGEVDLFAAAAGADGSGCSGQGPYAFLRNGGKIGVASGNEYTAVLLGAGHWTADGVCSLGFEGMVTKGHATYTFNLGPAG